MNLGIASDHAGLELKSKILEFLKEFIPSAKVIDYGMKGDYEVSDYPDYSKVLAKDISSHRIERGILICGTGIGMAIVANKFPKVQAVVVGDEYTAKMSRSHNDSNVICLGARVTHWERAIEFVKIWLNTPFEKGRHQNRIDKIRTIELGIHA